MPTTRPSPTTGAIEGPRAIAELFVAYVEAKRAQDRAPNTLHALEVTGRRITRVSDGTIINVHQGGGLIPICWVRS